MKAQLSAITSRLWLCFLPFSAQGEALDQERCSNPCHDPGRETYTEIQSVPALVLLQLGLKILLSREVLSVRLTRGRESGKEPDDRQADQEEQYAYGSLHHLSTSCFSGAALDAYAGSIWLGAPHSNQDCFSQAQNASKACKCNEQCTDNTDVSKPIDGLGSIVFELRNEWLFAYCRPEYSDGLAHAMLTHPSATNDNLIDRFSRTERAGNPSAY